MADYKKMYTTLKDIFDSNGILNPDIKLGASSKFTLTHFRSENRTSIIV